MGARKPDLLDAYTWRRGPCPQRRNVIVYEVVYVEAEAAALNSELACLSCGALLQARQGRLALKYFLLERPFSVRPRRAVGAGARRRP